MKQVYEQYEELNNLDLFLRDLGIKSRLFDIPTNVLFGDTYHIYIETATAFKERIKNVNRSVQ